ncbi:hypothetical protein PR048_023605 [Dryococelus australis]|uniref:Uncharacterized protein n=1 Tax=Dryococelus australis TaxID=614101 RepID=A0ABQ9GUM7_9NEOP|nr:hypothetical protein PR048_023605 [Dryococelus australis]
MEQWEKREIPEETRQAAASSGAIPTYKNPGATPPPPPTLVGFEPPETTHAAEIQRIEVPLASALRPLLETAGSFSWAGVVGCNGRAAVLTSANIYSQFYSSSSPPRIGFRPGKQIVRAVTGAATWAQIILAHPLHSAASRWWIQGLGGVVFRLLASHQGELGSIPDGVAPRTLARGDRAGRCHMSVGLPADPRFPRTPPPPKFSNAAPYPPQSALKTPILRDT